MAIKVATNFEILDKMPIDNRFVVENDSDLANIKAYAGLEVYIKSTSVKKRYTGTEWVAILNITKVSQLENDSGFITSNSADNKYIPLEIKSNEKLSILPSNANRDNAYVYVDNNGVKSKTTINNILNKKIRTVNAIPKDLQTGDYIFLELED